MKGVSFHSVVLLLLLMPAASAFSQDFVFIVIPDPQNLNSTVYSSQTQWIANNKAALNIVFSTCVGDLVNTATSSTEYEKADAAFDLLDVGGVPYSVSPGNHDMSTGTLWANYFGILRFYEKDWYGGSSGNYNTYSFFSASGNDFIVINLQYNPGTSQLDWADARLKEYPNHRGIVVQHDILNVNNSWNNQASYTALKDNPNLFLMLCGHMHTASDGAAYRAEPGDDGHTIHIVQADYQEFISPANTGYLRILRFSPENDMIYMTTYSPYTGGSITSTTNYDKADLAYNLNNLHYRSAGSGNWNNIANWEASSDLTSWVPALTYPNSTANTITVTNGQTLTVNDNVNVNQFTIEAGGAVTVPAGRTLTNSGAANDFVIKSTGSLSGSLITAGTGNVSGSVTYSRQMPGSSSSVYWHYVSSPLSLSSSPSGSFYAWNEVAGDWDASTTTIPASGRGYTLETNGNSISFVGSLVTSDFTVNATSPYLGTIDGTETTYDGRSWSNTGAGHSGTTIRSSDNYGGGGWNLLGNPYPSAMSVSAFIDANYSSTPSGSQFDPNYVALYLYNGSTYNYVAKSTGWPQGTYLSETHIQVGQGFFVLAMNDLSTFTFSRSMQGPDTDVSLLKSARAEEQWPGLQVKVKYGDKENSTLVVYNENMTAGLDPGYDIGLFSGGSELSIYTTLAEKDNSVNFTRQALPVSGADTIVVRVGIDF